MILTSADQLRIKPDRIISLVPSQTELLHHLGLETETIAITKFCVHPTAWFQTKIRVGGTKAIDIKRILDLQPDLIIAAKEENVKEQINALAAHFPVWVTDVKTLEDALTMIEDIGLLTHKNSEAKQLADQIHTAFAALSNSLTGKQPLKTAYLIWRNPYMTIGADTYVHNMMQCAGLQNVFAHTLRYPEISVDDIKLSGCTLLLLSSEPYPFTEKHIAELKAQLPGVKIILVDGEMFSWYGSRLLLAKDYLHNLRVQL